MTVGWGAFLTESLVQVPDACQDPLLLPKYLLFSLLYITTIIPIASFLDGHNIPSIISYFELVITYNHFWRVILTGSINASVGSKVKLQEPHWIEEPRLPSLLGGQVLYHTGLQAIYKIFAKSVNLGWPKPRIIFYNPRMEGWLFQVLSFFNVWHVANLALKYI